MDILEYEYDEGATRVTVTHRNADVWTGKLDWKNCKIYDGSIVKARLNNGTYWIVRYDTDICGFVLGTWTNNRCAGGSSSQVKHYHLASSKKLRVVSNNIENYCILYGKKYSCTEKECPAGKRGLIPDCHKRRRQR